MTKLITAFFIFLLQVPKTKFFRIVQLLTALLFKLRRSAAQSGKVSPVKIE